MGIEAYQHAPLSQPDKPDDIYIRLIKLPPGPPTGRIVCSLITTTLSQAPEFQALSYCWGDSAHQQIYIVPSASPNSSSTTWETDLELEDANARYLEVPGPLIPFLLRTRKKCQQTGKERLLWVDSISINQTDDTEKGQQVKRMRDIFIKAAAVLVWLGPTANRSDSGLKYAENLTKRWRKELAAKGEVQLEPAEREDVSHVKIKVGHPDLEALFAILDRPFFDRAWVVQEVVVARTCWIVIGDNVLHYLTFLSAYFYLITLHSWIFEFYPAHRIALLMNHRISGKEWEDKLNVEWWRLLSRHRECKSTEPRDKVFAFWGLTCKEAFKEMGINPEYGNAKNKRTEFVFWKLAVEGLKRGDVEVLGIPRVVLGRRGRGNVDTVTGDLKSLDMPSWVPDWRHTASTPDSLQRFEVTTSSWKPPYNASNGTGFLNPFGNLDPSRTNDDREETNMPQALPTELRLKGHIIARITALTPSEWTLNLQPNRQTIRTQAIILQDNQRQIVDWEEILVTESSASSYVPTNESILHARYKTMMSGIDYDNSEPLARAAYLAFEQHQKVLRFIAWIGLGRFLWPYVAVVWIGHFLRYLGIENPEWKFRTMIPGMINRKGARLQSDSRPVEYIGLVPGLCEIDDVVMVCQGIKVPLVLRNRDGGVGARGGSRETNTASDNRMLKWEFIGDAYVHGAMKGEVWDEQRCADICIT